MDKQIPEVLMQRTSKLMAERFLSKKDMAERLGMEYLTFWRKLNGKRGIDVVLLMKIADVLGTSTAYLLGETNNPNRDTSVPADTANKHYRTFRAEAPMSYGYWGDVTDKARDVATSGDKDAIAYVAQMLNLALSLLSSKSKPKQDVEKTATTTNGDMGFTNNPLMIGKYNENNLTIPSN